MAIFQISCNADLVPNCKLGVGGGGGVGGGENNCASSSLTGFSVKED